MIRFIHLFDMVRTAHPTTQITRRVRHAHQQPSQPSRRVRRAHHQSIQKTFGFSYMEVLVATVLIAITLVPAMDALLPGIQGSALHKQRAQIHYALSGKMEEVLSETFASLDDAATTAGAYTSTTSYSDTFSPTITRNVFIWRYDVDDADTDGDVFTGGEDDILWVKVSLPDDSLSLETLVSQY